MEVRVGAENYSELFIFCRNDVIQELVAEVVFIVVDGDENNIRYRKDCLKSQYWGKVSCLVRTSQNL